MARVDSQGRYAVPVPSGVRLIASDLDGTLLLSDGSVGRRTRESLDRLSASDLDLIIVGTVTGAATVVVLSTSPIVLPFCPRTPPVCPGPGATVPAGEQEVWLNQRRHGRED